MRLGTLIRLVLLLAWLALFVPHVVEHAAPGLGLSARDGAAGMLAANVGKEFAYDLVRAPDEAHLGTCRLGFERAEAGFTLETELRLADLSRLAPGLGLLPQLREARSREVRLQLTQRLDARQQLVGISANGRAFGMELNAVGSVEADGLRGTYTFADGAPTAYHLPEIGRDAGQGSDLALSLPPGLEPGDRFTTRLLSPDYARMRLGATTAVFTAVERESCLTAAGPLQLLKVEMQVDARVMSHLWCDAGGTVYRSRQQAGGMELRLTQIRIIGGGILWPPAAATR